VNHIVCKTINKINCKYYIGVHSTSDINDDYLGCGHWRGRKIYSNIKSPILAAFKKYGDDNFKKEILFIFENRDDALKKEKELIDIDDINCYNARSGGENNYIYTQKAKLKMSIKAKERSERLLLQTNILKEFNKNRIGKTYSKIYGEKRAKEISLKKSKSLSGRKCSAEHKLKMSLNRKGKDCGKCKGRKRVFDSISNKFIRLFPNDIETMISKGIIIKEFKKTPKFHYVNYVKIKD